jgi:tetratricopeptide (TPR) repeat protein
MSQDPPWRDAAFAMMGYFSGLLSGFSIVSLSKIWRIREYFFERRRHMNNSRFMFAALACCALLASNSSWANRNLTAGELALMPAFCQDVQTVNGWSQGGRESPRSPFWVSKMGRSFWDMHHYCWAGVAVLRSKQPGLIKRERDHLIQTAIDDYYYVINNAPENMILLPEIYYLIGESHKALGQIGLAVDAFQKSRSLKPDYWPAYTGHADLLMQANLRVEARAVLLLGIAVMPDEAALKSRLEQLGAGGGNPQLGEKKKKSQATDRSSPSAPRAVAPKPFATGNESSKTPVAEAGDKQPARPLSPSP